MPGVASASGSGIWSRLRDEITFDRLQKFWNDLPPQARQELLKLDKQTLIEQARKNFYCSRCNGLLLESFTQIVIYGKSLQQEGLDISQPRTTTESKITQGEQDGTQDPSVHPWGGLSTTKDGVLTLLDCFIKAKSLRVLQNVFDNARAREREREMLYPDACGAGGRGWISQGMVNYRGHGTREMCALHTAHLSCDTLVDFWSALGEDTRSSLLRMKEEDFIEKLMYRFDNKRFCRECRRNVIREFKELKELKRMRREPRCTSWFCVTDTAFQCEVFEDAVIVDWRQCFSEPDGSYHHFEWAIGTDEGESDIFGFEDVGLNARVQRNGINLDQFEDYFITLRACRFDDQYTELCVKAHALKGQSCVHHRLVVGDGFVTMTKGETIRNFFEHAEEAEEEDEDDAMDRDGNDFDSDGSHPQKHAKSPELAREFLLDAAAVIFKEQVEKAFRQGTAQQNAHSVFVSLALKLLEERVHVACKEIITLEKQNKLLEEEEKEKREEQERRMKRRTKEREKKLRRKERLKEKENKGKRLVEPKSPDGVSSSTLSSSSTSTNDSTNTLDLRDSATEEEDNAEVVNLCSPDSRADQSSCGQNSIHGNTVTEFSPMYSSDLCTSEESKSLRRSPWLREDFAQDQPCWYDDCHDESGRISDLQWQLWERTRSSEKSCGAASATNNRTRDRPAYNSCSCGNQEHHGVVDNCFLSTARSGREMKMARKSGFEKPKAQYRRCYALDSFVVSKGTRIGSAQKNAIPKQVWEPMDARKKTNLDNAACSVDSIDALKPVDSDTSGCKNIDKGCESQPLASESSRGACKSDQQCESTSRSQAAACDGTLMVNKESRYPGDDEGSRHDEELMTNSSGSDSSSSCMSEGDREISSSSMTSSSAQNPESSSSESEESPDRTNSTVGAPSSRTASRSLLEACAGNGFREYQPKATRRVHNERFGFNITPFEDQLLRHHSMHVHPHSPATTGLHNRSWATETNGNFHYARPTPTQLYSSPLVFGVPGNHFVDYPVQYSSINPYMAPAFSHMPPEPIHKTTASFRAMPPSPPFQNGYQEIASRTHRDMNLESHPSKLTIPSGMDRPEDKNKSGPKYLSEDKNKSQDVDASFSLFQFNLPIAAPVTPSSKDDKSREQAATTPLVQAQLCSREQAGVKEYNLFSSKDNGIFSSSKDNGIFSFM